MSLETMQPFEQSFTVSQQDPNYLFSTGDANNYLLETFHQYPQGDFRPTFYNPFEIKHRRRTSRAQLKVLERSFAENPKPNATIRRILAQRLDMTPRGVQIWFQNRRAKAKLQRRKSFAQNQLDERGGATAGEQGEYPKQDSLCRNESDLSQSSVLFSQFFANVQDRDGGVVVNNSNNVKNSNKNILSAFSSPSSSQDVMNQSLSNNNSNNNNGNNTSTWSVWQKQDNARSVAPLAAIKAEESSSPITSFNSSVMSLENNQNWRNMSMHSLQAKPAQHPFENDVSSTMRRKSCPAPNMNSSTSYTDSNHTNQMSMDSQGWYSNMLSYQNKANSDDKNSINNNIKRHASYDSQTPISSHPNSPDYYMPPDMKMIYAQKQKQQQSTPPLTASCSASTVSGSPISLDNLFNESNTSTTPSSSNNNYYGNSANSSPLASQQMW